MAKPTPEFDDIQGLLKSGYGPLDEAAYLLLQVRDAAKAKTWLRTYRPTTMGDLSLKVATASHLAISAPGLLALGVSAEVVERFAPEFASGMAADEARSRRLGDIGSDAPANWTWGGAGSEPHALLMLFGRGGGLSAIKATLLTADFTAAFEVTELATAPLDGREPFGFVDGLSQPKVDWAGKRDADTMDDLDYGNLISPGEFVLGYPNEYGLITRAPHVDADDDPAGILPRNADGNPDIGRNGTYLVFRQLYQDVAGFWGFVDAHGGLPLAESMVGRTMDGDPLVRTGDRPILGVDDDEVAQNGFDFESDGAGIACPFTGHIRRANPRTGDMPGGEQGILRKLAGTFGFGIDRHADTIAASRFHRLLRRGRKYGDSPGRDVDPAAPPADTGIHFICLGANIARQFEFVQGAWLASARFAGLTGEQDPLLGLRQPFPADCPTDAFRQPQREGPPRELTGLPQFVTLKGGAYFFLPGVRALRWIAHTGSSS